MSIHYIDREILAGGTLVLTIDFFDDNGIAVEPNEIFYTLRMVKTGEVVNGIEDEAVAPATSVDIVLSGDDLPEGRLRLYLWGTYDSTSGNNLPFRHIVEFAVRRFK